MNYAYDQFKLIPLSFTYRYRHSFRDCNHLHHFPIHLVIHLKEHPFRQCISYIYIYIYNFNKLNPLVNKFLSLRRIYMQTISSHRVKSYFYYAGVVLNISHSHCLHSFIVTGNILWTCPGDILLWGGYLKVRSVLILVLGCNLSYSLR